MNREQIMGIVQSGGSVLWRGRLLTRPDDVPNDTELATATTDQLDVRINYLTALIDEYTAERAALIDSRGPTSTPAPSTAGTALPADQDAPSTPPAGAPARPAAAPPAPSTAQAHVSPLAKKGGKE